MGSNWFKEFGRHFFQQFTIFNLIITLIWSLIVTFAFWLLTLAYNFKIENEGMFWLFSSIAFFGIIVVFKALFGRELTYPQLTPEIDVYMAGPVPASLVSPGKDIKNGTLLTLIVSVRNSGMPTILENWSVSVVLSDGTEHQGELRTVLGNVTLQGPSGQQNKYSQSEFIFNKCNEEPLVTGGMVRGLLLVVFNHIKEDIFGQPGHKLVLKFIDVLATEHKIERPTLVGGSEEMKYYPGLSSIKNE